MKNLKELEFKSGVYLINKSTGGVFSAGKWK